MRGSCFRLGGIWLTDKCFEEFSRGQDVEIVCVLESPTDAVIAGEQDVGAGVACERDEIVVGWVFLNHSGDVLGIRDNVGGSDSRSASSRASATLNQRRNRSSWARWTNRSSSRGDTMSVAWVTPTRMT